ncbi:uncharacterized protein ASCRUDRAFT_6160 [Ascoidea rubescens DSM 1968]|uniref:Uncharacterized protein n=1 Tax=Ascoidea rubescens DSM 1968 TaxID=1344418 RepID=A0A1D2VRU5_9ASCO|nr:hypothetical protein ASCRUDRAFT_6160 [Ascoidea rubescens DSM 1968]ODV64319.1 hypothetical protein ASCRUDRAFT_6160 [Ascoidea rubescens DSM 1968]
MPADFNSSGNEGNEDEFILNFHDFLDLDVININSNDSSADIEILEEYYADSESDNDSNSNGNYFSEIGNEEDYFIKIKDESSSSILILSEIDENDPIFQVNDDEEEEEKEEEDEYHNVDFTLMVIRTFNSILADYIKLLEEFLACLSFLIFFNQIPDQDQDT